MNNNPEKAHSKLEKGCVITDINNPREGSFKAGKRLRHY
jgi:hypothetical protein